MLRYAITDSSLFHGDDAGMLEKLLAIAPEIDCLQVRERTWTTSRVERFVAELLRNLAALPRRPRVLVNHHVDVAIATGADGVHLRASPGELRPPQVREIYASAGLKTPVLVSASCHTLDEAKNAATDGADLILFGPVFGKRLKDEVLPGVGLGPLAQACRAAANVPVLALGGVTRQNAGECISAGAAGVAGIRLFLR